MAPIAKSVCRSLRPSPRYFLAGVEPPLACLCSRRCRGGSPASASSLKNSPSMTLVDLPPPMTTRILLRKALLDSSPTDSPPPVYRRQFYSSDVPALARIPQSQSEKLFQLPGYQTPFA